MEVQVKIKNYTDVIYWYMYCIITHKDGHYPLRAKFLAKDSWKISSPESCFQRDIYLNYLDKYCTSAYGSIL